MSLSIEPRPLVRGRIRQGPNCLLATLPRSVYSALAPSLVTRTLRNGEVLYEPLARIGDVYFPDTTLLSIIAEMSDGAAVEVGTVGTEGFLGLPVLFGVAAAPTQWVAQVPGVVRVLPAKVLTMTLSRSTSLRDTLMRYAHTFLHQVGQTSACRVLHSVPQRCARWLLVADDTAGANGSDAQDGFLLTQQYLGYMLGARREGVSAAASVLRDAGLIRFSRGHITVTNRAGLERASCECYRASADEYRRVLGVGGNGSDGR